MQLAGLLALSLIVAAVLRRRPVVIVCLYLTVWTLLPAVASDSVTGESGGLGLHASTWFLLIAFAICFLSDLPALLTALRTRPLLYIALALFIAAACLETKGGDSGNGLVLVVDQIIGPMVALWLLDSALLSGRGRLETVRRTVIVLAAVQAAYAIGQYLTNTVILYGNFYVQRYWYSPDFHRWMGTTDHPLVLSMMLCAAIPLLVTIRRTTVQAGLLALLVVGIVVTQARTGVVAAGLGTIYLIVASSASAGRKIVLSLAMTIAAGFLAASTVSTGVLDRIANDGGSALARGSAWNYFISSFTHFLFKGGGVNSSYVVAENAGLHTSFESAFIMYSVDFGLFFALVFFGAQLALVARGATAIRSGFWLAGLLVIGLCQTFSSLASETLIGPLIWILLAASANVRPDAATPDQNAVGEAGRDGRVELNGRRRAPAPAASR